VFIHVVLSKAMASSSAELTVVIDTPVTSEQASLPPAMELYRIRRREQKAQRLHHAAIAQLKQELHRRWCFKPPSPGSLHDRSDQD
tara:strand:- start:156 stop:413 length:258 start_codon:yes stop_codon:yes gene_type:complete